MPLTWAACAVCGGRSFEDVYPGTVEVESGEHVREYFGSSRTRAGHLPIVRCTRCHLLMTNPQDDPGTLAGVYRDGEDPAYEAEYENRARAAADHLRVVTRHTRPPGRILDIGCATGIFVGAAHDAGWQASGVDASVWMIAKARARCSKADFREGALDTLEFPPGVFDVITLWDVLEHVPEPAEVLRRVRSWLRAEGRLCLSVPNGRSLMARAMGRHWVLLLREHLWYFCPPTISRLLDGNGFEVVEVRSKWVKFSVGNILARMSQYSKRSGPDGARLAGARVLRRLSLRFPIGEMDVVARLTK